jgi:hypothetical protein
MVLRMTVLGRLQPLDTVHFKCVCHRTTRSKATRGRSNRARFTADVRPNMRLHH